VNKAIARSVAESTSFEEAHRYADNAAFQESRKETIFGAAKRAFQQKLDKLSDPMSYINPVADEDANAFSQTEDALAPVIGGDSAEALHERAVNKAIARSVAESTSFEEAYRYAEEAVRLERMAEEAFQVDDRFAPRQPLPQGDIRGEKGYNFPGTNTPVKQHAGHLRSLTNPRVVGEGADLRLTHDSAAAEDVVGSVSKPETQQRRIKLL